VRVCRHEQFRHHDPRRDRRRQGRRPGAGTEARRGPAAVAERRRGARRGAPVAGRLARRRVSSGRRGSLRGRGHSLGRGRHQRPGEPALHRRTGRLHRRTRSRGARGQARHRKRARLGGRRVGARARPGQPHAAHRGVQHPGACVLRRHRLRHRRGPPHPRRVAPGVTGKRAPGGAAARSDRWSSPAAAPSRAGCPSRRAPGAG
jgi:hypothetical protein